MPVIIVTSPGCHVSACPRATIQDRMSGATAARISSQSNIENV